MVYGQKKLNSHYTLSYGLTKEFFQGYKHLCYLNVEIPPTLIRHFHSYIKPWVTHHRVKRRSVLAMKKKHQMNTMEQAQAALCRYPATVQNLATDVHRNTIAIHIRLIDFALDKLKNHHVILIAARKSDEKHLAGKSIPEHFNVFWIPDAWKSVKLSAKKVDRIRKIICTRQKIYAKHPIFGTTRFRNWLFNKAIHATKMIFLLDTLIRNESIKLIIDQTELVNPGNILSLLAKKYNLPFVCAPQALVTDFAVLPSRASYYFVWGPHMRSWMKMRGISPRKIKTTGNLRFHYNLASNRTSKESNFPSILSKQTKIVSYLTQTYDQSVNKDVMGWIFTAARKHPDIQFLIKTHPADPFHYDAYMNVRNIHLLPKDTNLYDVLRYSDLIMTISSNTAFEAAILNKAIIVLQPKIPYDFDNNNNDFRKHLAHAHAGPVAKNDADLTRQVGNFFSHSTFRNQVHTQAQQFIKCSLQTSSSPANVTYTLIQRILQGDET